MQNRAVRHYLETFWLETENLCCWAIIPVIYPTCVSTADEQAPDWDKGTARTINNTYVLFASLPSSTWYIYIIKKERIVILSFYIPSSATEKNEWTLVMIGHLIPLRLIYLRDKGEILLPPDKCTGQLFIVNSESPTYFLVPCLTKLYAVLGGISNYSKPSCLMVLEFWLTENKKVLFWKPCLNGDVSSTLHAIHAVGKEL